MNNKNNNSTTNVCGNKNNTRNYENINGNHNDNNKQ